MSCSVGEMQLPAYTTATATAMRDQSHVCDLWNSSRQRQIPNPQCEARDRTHILMDTSRIRLCCAPMEISPTLFGKVLAEGLDELELEQGAVLQFVGDILITGPTEELSDIMPLTRQICQPIEH